MSLTFCSKTSFFYADANLNLNLAWDHFSALIKMTMKRGGGGVLGPMLAGYVPLVCRTLTTLKPILCIQLYTPSQSLLVIR